MTTVQLLSFALLVGITACGIFAAMLELGAGTAVRFAEPFMSRSRPLRSLLAAACAGPFMLANDTLEAWRDGRISGAALSTSALICAVWALVAGVVVLGAAAWGLAFLA